MAQHNQMKQPRESEHNDKENNSGNSEKSGFQNNMRGDNSINSFRDLCFISWTQWNAFKKRYGRNWFGYRDNTSN